jgi:hypothetical protein
MVLSAGIVDNWVYKKAVEGASTVNQTVIY